MDQEGLLDNFFDWYIQKYGAAAGGSRLEKIKEAQRALKEDFEEVAGVRKMKGKDWVRLRVPIGIGTRGKGFSSISISTHIVSSSQS